jgi:YidC/Oxa1 family membrane protein insertase
MNGKDILLPLGLALITTWVIQYFFFNTRDTQGSKQERSGQSFVAPETPLECKPLLREVNFIDEKRSTRAELTSIETPLATYVFSTDGACLYRFDAKRTIQGAAHSLTTIFPLSEADREGRCFLIGLAEKTPYYYQLIQKKEEGDIIEIMYGYQSQQASVNIIKKYILFKDTYRIILEMTLEPLENSAVTPRIIFPSPLMPEIVSYDAINALVGGVNSGVQKIPMAKVTSTSGWFDPLLFGTDNKYFVHALVGDQQKFAKRGYYSAAKDKLLSIVEGPTITEKTTWALSFYVGPKEEAALAVVSERLEHTLDYSGWLAPIAKVALALLKWFYNYLKNYGLAIIALTLLIKLIMLPFTWHAEQSVKQRAEFQRKLQYLQQKYKHDQNLLAQERAELIKKHGMPGLAGCLPILIQIPIFFALNRVLSSSIELYKAPFYGWITDLSATDPYFILPLLIIISMLLQAATADKQQRFAVVAMALVFGAISANLAAGLCLYILVSTVLSVGQTALQRKFKGA